MANYDIKELQAFFERSLAKAWPKNDQENHDNANVHAVMEDSMYEQGAVRKEITPQESLSRTRSFYTAATSRPPGHAQAVGRVRRELAGGSVPGRTDDVPAINEDPRIGFNYDGNLGQLSNGWLAAAQHNDRRWWTEIWESLPLLAKASPDDPGTKEWREQLAVDQDAVMENHPSVRVVATPTKDAPVDLADYGKRGSIARTRDANSETYANAAEQGFVGPSEPGPEPIRRWRYGEGPNGAAGDRDPWRPDTRGWDHPPAYVNAYGDQTPSNETQWWRNLFDISSPMAKAWPKNDAENHDNANVHAVMEDSMYEQGAVKKPVDETASHRAVMRGVGRVYNKPTWEATRGAFQAVADARQANWNIRNPQGGVAGLGVSEVPAGNSDPGSGFEPRHSFYGRNYSKRLALHNDRAFWESLEGAVQSNPPALPFGVAIVDVDLGTGLNKADGDMPEPQPTELPKSLARHHIFSGKPYGIVTAENPQKGVPTAGDNVVLEQRLKQHGLKYSPVRGNYGQDENSFVVYHPSLEQMKSLGQEFGQESVVYGANGEHQIHYTTGDNVGHHHPTIPGRAINYFAQQPGQYWTEIPGGGGFFNINVDWNTKHGQPKGPKNPMIRKSWPTDAESKANHEAHLVLQDHLQENGKVIKPAEVRRDLKAKQPAYAKPQQRRPTPGFAAARQRVTEAMNENLNSHYRGDSPAEPAGASNLGQSAGRTFDKKHFYDRVLDNNFWISVGQSVGLNKANPSHPYNQVLSDQLQEQYGFVPNPEPKLMGTSALRAGPKSNSFLDNDDTEQVAQDHNREQADRLNFKQDQDEMYFRPEPHSGGPMDPNHSFDPDDSNGPGGRWGPDLKDENYWDHRGALSVDSDSIAEQDFWSDVLQSLPWKNKPLIKAWPKTPDENQQNIQDHLVLQDHLHLTQIKKP